jgi:glyoxylase-like metal-dependent hydrolase (beta-lactamase superfamily II)
VTAPGGDEAGRVLRLSRLVRRVLAPNPSPLTLEGTNTYLVGAGEALLLVDPGPADAGHLARLEAAVGRARVAAVVLTHRHVDHAEAAGRCAERFGAPVVCARPAGPADRALADGDRVVADGATLRAVATPGHSSDHLSFLLEEERALLTGDHVLGRGTTVVAHPDGDMAAYLASLERIRALDLARIYPGHGPVIEDPARVLAEYVEHRLMRERQVLDGLAAGPATPEELVARIYVDVDPILHAAAALSVRAHLAKLAREGRVVQEGDRWRRS